MKGDNARIPSRDAVPVEVVGCDTAVLVSGLQLGKKNSETVAISHLDPLTLPIGQALRHLLQEFFVPYHHFQTSLRSVINQMSFDISTKFCCIHNLPPVCGVMGFG